MKFKIPAGAVNKIAESIANQLVQSVKDIPSNIMSSIRDRFLFTMTIDEKSEAYYAFQEWFYKNYEHKFKSVTVYNVAKNSDGERVKNSSIRSWDTTSFSFGIGYSQNSGTYSVNHEGLKLTNTKGIKEGDKAVGEKSLQFYTLTGTNKDGIKKLVEDIYDEYNNQHDQIKIFVSDVYGDWKLVKRITGKTLDNIVIDKDLHHTLVNDVNEFEGDQEWYASLNIPYKRGYLLHGPPGNGKTSLAIAIASEHKRNIYCLDINKLRDDSALRNAFSSLQSNSLLLVEDVDVAFAMPRDMNDKKKHSISVTFGCLLNCLDGVYYKEGLLTVMTTNHIENLDAALIRPGRIDLKIFIPNPGKEEVECYLSRFYRKPIVLESFSKTIPMAAVQGVCIMNKHDSDKAIYDLLNDEVTVIQMYTTPVGPFERETDLDRDEEEDEEEGESLEDDDNYENALDRLLLEGGA